MMRIYMDVCCWNRPFDDQMQVRIHLEAEAVLAIVEDILRDRFQLVHSEVVELEIADTPVAERRKRLQLMIPKHHSFVRCSPRIEKRSLELASQGFAGVDALHVASAEAGGADFFLTTDDRLLKTAERCASDINVEVANPLEWIKKMEENGT
jgi:predicted nucleic acid-binding protein